MSKAIIYISFHPGSLSKYAYIREIYAKEYLSILIICKHPYVNSEIISRYSRSFDHLIILPDIQYKANIFQLMFETNGFLKDFNQKIRPILASLESFHIVSNSSAWLPVNLLLSRLRRIDKCIHSISLSDDSDTFYAPVAKSDIDILKSGYLMLLALLLRIYLIYFHKRLGFLYIKLPIDRMLRFSSPFLHKSPSSLNGIIPIPVYSVTEPFRQRLNSKKDIVIIYGDVTAFKEYGCALRYEVYQEKLVIFFSCLSKHYNDCELVYKPHPLDNGKIMPGLDSIRFKLYEGSLISQLHLDLNIDRVKACYSVGSFSLHYSASKGIPSYAFYKYLEFNRQYPDTLFKDIAGLNPFFRNIRKVEEIGAIDSIDAPPTECEYSSNWSGLLSETPIREK